MFIAVRSDKCALQGQRRKKANCNAPFLRLPEKLLTHRRPILCVCVTLQEHYDFWRKLIHEFAELDVGRNPHGVYTLPKILDPPIEQAFRSFEYGKAEATGSQINRDDAVAVV